MKDCQSILEGQLPKIRELIEITEQDDHEHAYAFSQTKSTSIVLGDCNNVERPTIDDMIGTVHAHTIPYSRISEADIETFKNTKDQIMCYVVPKEGVWNIQCYDKELGVCGEYYV
jgi:hypothetical protein